MLKAAMTRWAGTGAASISRGIFFLLVAAIAAPGAIAQTSSDSEPIRRVEVIDPNGVDLRSGALTLRTEEVTIGASDGPVFRTTPVNCGKPIWSRDAKGNQTDYTYDPVHGGLLTETLPASANGVRPQKRYQYQQMYAYIRNNSGGFSPAATPVWKLIRTSECITQAQCAGTADEIVTEFTYGIPGTANNLLLTATTIRTGNGSLSQTTSLTYDPIGNVVSEDGPKAGSDDTTYFFYDNARRLIGEVSPDPDGAGPLLRQARRMSLARAKPSLA